MSRTDLVNELHHAARKNFARRQTQMRGIEDSLQADLVEMIPYATKNKNMRYILTVINIFSKKAYARALKNKTGREVTRAMTSILDSIEHSIKNLHVDRGSEFYNGVMQKMLTDRGIHLYSTFSSKKAAIIERFNRTLKSKMWKIFSLRGSYKWIDILSKLINEYNDTKHRTIGMKPNQVNKRNEQQLLNTVYNYRHTITNTHKPKFQIGDPVRLSKYKNLFDKGYTPNWTTEIFKIRKIVYTVPITYLIESLSGEEILGTVYAEELQLAKHSDLYLVERIIRKRGDKCYVKWLGFDSSHNSWITKNDIF